MNERKFLETLFERYVNNMATDHELEVFLDLLKQGKLDELARAYMDREAEKEINPDVSTMGQFRPWIQWLNIAASLSLVLGQIV
ncbi:hypothetical protein [Spirosoma validum]|uniref:Uncharacterized protein n=1 Tax=Spirosoma validum TaxID=2771355 RepID=A0A927B781_9BACT|nr:hypothetical protein [Spirosoma validum]MBD2756481.1 hypothetical protein [Spirosoma validum]